MKNKMMRAASVLMVAVLLSTCAISGTFAKYVTSDTGTDSARVAKWGVTINVQDDMGMFSNGYKADNTVTNTASEASVLHATEQLVAPGTKGSTSFTISGTPEVRNIITVDTTGSTPIRLGVGNYTLAAGKYANIETTVSIADDANAYEPIRFYFGTVEGDLADANNYTLTMTQLQSAINAELHEKTNNPGTALDVTYYIGWNWAFDNTIGVVANANADFFDTWLAQQVSTQTMTLNLTVTITQVD